MTAETRTLAEFAANLSYAAIPAEVPERTRMLILDHVGIALRARNAADLREPMSRGLAALGLTRGNSTVIGDAQDYTPGAAALFNGNLGHALDFDDTHARASLHSGAPIIPAAMAAAEMSKAAGRDVITGIIAGFEVQTRLSLALGPTDHYNRGFHPTATCGVFGAAAAAGRVLGLTADQMVHAFGLCGSQAAGSMQFLADGAWNKPFHTGYAAMNGLNSAVMAKEGFRGTLEPVEGRLGFLKGYAPNPQPGKSVAGLGEVWETMAIALKPYPSCRYGHAAMDALIAIRAEHGVEIDDVESIQIGLPKTGIKLIGDPEEDKQRPKNYVDGQFSMAFVGAVALREGRMTWDDYAKHLKDPDTLALCLRIHTVPHPKVEAEFPTNMSGLATVKLRSGETLEKMVVIPKGEPDNFLTAEELREKFDGLTGPYLSAERRDKLASALLKFDEVHDVHAVLALTAPESTAGLKVASGGQD
ncbi:MAG TPA: MmgE/PrpD family protein [Gammaproteobacteria bacterium]|nr:MmgE/PrpD family protein [Gammaproteobacteria bacterium]